MGEWRSKLLKASFKEVPFEVESYNYAVGRRNAVHEYANRSTPYVQDMGKKAEEFNINGYIIQNKRNDFNHFTNRNSLIKAFQSFGPGVLVHPYYGIRKVAVKGQAKFTENVKEGGIVKFTVTFVEAGTRLPNSIKEGKAAVDVVVNVGQDLIGDKFEIEYEISGGYMVT